MKTIFLLILLIAAQFFSGMIPLSFLWIPPLLATIFVWWLQLRSTRILDLKLYFLFAVSFSIGWLVDICIDDPSLVESAGALWKGFVEGGVWALPLGGVQWVVFKVMTILSTKIAQPQKR